MKQIYYHNNFRINKSYIQETFDSWADVYESKQLELTHHINLIGRPSRLDHPDCVNWDSGLLIIPSLINFLNVTGAEPRAIETLVPDTPNGILIIYFNSLFNCNKEQLDTIFNYKGHILIDDAFEPHLQRVAVCKEWLEHLGYDLSNVSFWTNVPDFDNKIDYDSKIIRHNWLHLEEYFRSGRNRIYEIDDKDSLKKFSNKKYNFLYMNGHCTHQRAYVLGSCINVGLDFNSMLFSYDRISNISNFYDPIKILDHIPPSNQTLHKSYEYRKLPGDWEDGVTVRDRFKQDWWWTESFFNINVETQLHWRNHRGRFISEKWMKGILYLTPSFNIGDYHGLEEYQTTLGFNNYSEILPKTYDNLIDWRARGHQFAICLDKAVQNINPQMWAKCMEIAEFNYQHLHHKYIPNLSKVFYDTLENVVENT